MSPLPELTLQVQFSAELLVARNKRHPCAAVLVVREAGSRRQLGRTCLPDATVYIHEQHTLTASIRTCCC